MDSKRLTARDIRNNAKLKKIMDVIPNKEKYDFYTVNETVMVPLCQVIDLMMPATKRRK